MSIIEDSGPQPRSSGEEPARDRVALAECFARARSILSALVTGVKEGDAVIVATDQNGFPVAQRVIERPKNLPHAVVIGRHNRCALSIPNDSRVSLRHLLLTAWPGQGPMRLRGYDLGGRAGVVLADGKRVPGFSAHGQVALAFGRTSLFVLPGGPAGQEMLEGEEAEAFRKLTGLDTSGAGHRLAISAMAEPGVAEIGGYRPIDIDVRPSPRGALRLRSTKPDRGRSHRSRKREDSAQVRELEIDSELLQRGLLIGRYSDRCSLAGQGRNLSRVHALVTEEGPNSLLVYDLASTNGVRPTGQSEGPSHPVVRMTPDDPCLLGHFELSWVPAERPTIH
ncbi:FHA domain-containing protein [Pseudenhygromyxa sp. WMMC2535]|uniref:FHA domain-containing protein n=1 Tax=Pseudenhygromyxa sp. WMMC2535 TaxID=2712867 RepID=UPI00159552B7|nr:FHA domain-containing protein [Pseudenhygromyxa sp. WMMC2535]